MSRLVRARDNLQLHPREDSIALSASFLATNAEVVLDLDGEQTVSVDLRASGITGAPIAVLEGSTDGINYPDVIPLYRRDVQLFVTNACVGTGSSSMVADVVGYRRVRLRLTTAPTAGSYGATLRGSIGDFMALVSKIPSTVLGTNTGASGAAVTLTLAAPGIGLFHYISGLYIERHATALLTAGATPVIATTSNMPGALAFSIPADAAAQGTVYEKKFEPGEPIKSSASNTATTFVCPIATTVIWRITAIGYVGA